MQPIAWGWGLLKPSFSLLAKFSISWESLNHIHIWQVSPQLCCSDICQIWMWHSIGNQPFHNEQKLKEKKTDWIEIGWVTPPPACPPPCSGSAPLRTFAVCVPCWLCHCSVPCSSTRSAPRSREPLQRSFRWLHPALWPHTNSLAWGLLSVDVSSRY